MTAPELTKEQHIEIYTQNAETAAEQAMIDFKALRAVGFDEDFAGEMVMTWHGKAVIG